MTISEQDRQIIKARAQFLETFGYKLVYEDAHNMRYSNNEIEFDIFSEPYEDWSDIEIKFLKQNEGFYLGWITNCNPSVPKLYGTENLAKQTLLYLEYIETYYDKLTNIAFCREAETRGIRKISKISL